MANIAIPSPSLQLQLSNRVPPSSSSSSSSSFSLSPNPRLHRSLFLFTTRATQPETPPSDSDPSQPESKPPSTAAAAVSDDTFESRMSEFRLRNRSGKGKKAELRKVRKKGASGSGSRSGVYLPPVPLKEAVSGGLKVDFGFSSYSERLNGRIAILGLTALLLVELATGKSVINYHTPAIVLIQIYFVAAVSAIYVKYEKEKISVWPNSSSSSKE